MAEGPNIPRHGAIYGHFGYRPMRSDGVFVAPNAAWTGKVSFGTNAGVWFSAVFRAEEYIADGIGSGDLVC